MKLLGKKRGLNLKKIEEKEGKKENRRILKFQSV